MNTQSKPSGELTCAVYIDLENRIRHTLVYEVSENGCAHRVVHSHLGFLQPLENPSSVRRSAERYFGPGNVKIFSVKEEAQ